MRRRKPLTSSSMAALVLLIAASVVGCDSGEEMCRDECTLDDTRCLETLVQVCVEGADGCMTWHLSHDCREESGTCVAVGDSVGCEAGCSDECGSGELTCWDDVLMSCSLDTVSGCTTWYVEQDCAEGGEVCEVSGTSAACGPP